MQIMALSTHDAKERLGQITCPTLVIHGDKVGIAVCVCVCVCVRACVRACV